MKICREEIADGKKPNYLRIFFKLFFYVGKNIDKRDKKEKN